MATDIEWTRGDDGSKGETWNPTVGCSRVSPGCDGCYAIGVAHRAMQPAHEGLTDLVHDGSRTKGYRVDWTGEVRLLPDRLDTPLHWRKPRRVFVDSMSDLFHPDVPAPFIRRVWSTMSVTPRHTYQILTKRPQRMASFMAAAVEEWGEGLLTVLPNVWLGTSVENQRYADLRIPHLLATPAAVRFLSIEPLLGPVDLMGAVEPDWIGSAAGGSGAPHPLVDWVIIGGESGPGARPMHPDWVRSIRDQCVAAGVPFFFKQWGEWLPLVGHREHMDLGARERAWERVELRPGAGTSLTEGAATVVRVGKKAAGRELDGRTWDEMPA